jgi:hypothetical protein
MMMIINDMMKMYSNFDFVRIDKITYKYHFFTQAAFLLAPLPNFLSS